jgi:hypothetical protein
MMPFVNRAARMALLAGEPAAADSIATHGHRQVLDVQPWDSLTIGRLRLVQARARLALHDSASARDYSAQAERALRAHSLAAARELPELREARDLAEVLRGEPR